MVRKIEKSIPWITILAIFSMLVFGGVLFFKEALADSSTPRVSVPSAAPTVGTIILNLGNAINLTEYATTAVTGTTTITDANGWADIVAVTSTLYLTQTTTCNDGSSQVKWCYATTDVATVCSTLSTTTNTRIVSCTAYVWYVAEPSDASSSYPTKDWKMEITAIDTALNRANNSTTKELNSIPSLDVYATTNYGSVSPGVTSTQQTVTSTVTGNISIDLNLSGTDFATTEGGYATISANRQTYSSTSMGNGTSSVGVSLWNTLAIFKVTLATPTATTTANTTSTYWIIDIPPTQAAAVYVGANTFLPIPNI